MLNVVIKNKRKIVLSEYEIGKFKTKDILGKDLYCYGIFDLNNKEQIYISESIFKVQYLFSKMIFCEQNNLICNIEQEMEKFDE